MKQYKIGLISRLPIIILDEKITVGAVRVARINESTCRVSHIFILPRFQNRGYAQETLREVEKLYPNANEWRLDTIKEESKLKYLYEKSVYTPAGVEEKIKDGMTIVYYSKNVTL